MKKCECGEGIPEGSKVYHSPEVGYLGPCCASEDAESVLLAGEDTDEDDTDEDDEDDEDEIMRTLVVTLRLGSNWDEDTDEDEDEDEDEDADEDEDEDEDDYYLSRYELESYLRSHCGDPRWEQDPHEPDVVRVRVPLGLRKTLQDKLLELACVEDCAEDCAEA